MKYFPNRNPGYLPRHFRCAGSNNGYSYSSQLPTSVKFRNIWGLPSMWSAANIFTFDLIERAADNLELRRTQRLSPLSCCSYR